MENALIRRHKPHEASKFWDPVRVEYPVRLAAAAGPTSQALGHPAPCNPQVLTHHRRDTAVRGISHDVIECHGNAASTRELCRSQHARDYGYQPPTGAGRFCRATPAGDNLYIHGGNRKLDAYPIRLDGYVSSETFSSYRPPPTAASARTLDMARGALPCAVQRPESPMDPYERLYPMDSSADSLALYLDPYVTASRLEHRPFTRDHLESCSNSRDIITYYTLADVPRVRGPYPYAEEWWLPRGAQARRQMSDRKQFRHDFREVRVHNRPPWTPTAFKTETASKFILPNRRVESAFNLEYDNLKECYRYQAATLRPDDVEKEAYCRLFTTESRDMKGQPLLARVDQLAESTICRPK